MEKRLTSLIPVEEKLLESEYFASRLNQIEVEAFQYELNAFLSAARSVTFVLQKEMSNVAGFEAWWVEKQNILRRDAVAKFFIELRNYSQKQGKLPIVGEGVHRGGRRYCKYYFAGGFKQYPKELLHREVQECCHEHIAKLANLALEFASEFPLNACYRNALTKDGIQKLQVDLESLTVWLGLSSEWLKVAPNVDGELYRVLRSMVDGVDFDTIKRISSFRPTHTDIQTEQIDSIGSQLGRSIRENLSKSNN